MAEYRKEDFVFEEDSFLEARCDGCNYTTDDEDELDSEEFDGCPDCGGTMVIETCHEGLTCSICGKTFSCWEDYYAHKAEPDTYICDDCYEELEE